MNNKPKYNFFKNSKYAIDGLFHALKTEKSFRIELFLSVIIIVCIVLIDISLVLKLILFTSGILILVVELINSAIENVVDLVTKDIHPLAKTSKDIGATAVMFSILLHLSCWVIILIDKVI